jgi:exonuclease SbcC
MIHSLDLKNFQSHKESSFSFHPGVNSIIGSSNHGKTAVLRALYWLINNRPSGAAFVSHWARNDKGKQTSSAEVSGSFDDKSMLTRARTETENQYIHEVSDEDPSKYNAVRTDVPTELADMMNIGEVNIQKQMDSPFLLSETAGEVARFFNRLIRLDIIDNVLSKAESQKREHRSSSVAAEKDIVELNEKITGYKWIDMVETLLKKAERFNERIEMKETRRETLESTFEEYRESREFLKSIPDVKTTEENLKKIESIQRKVKERKNQLSRLQSSEEEYKNTHSVIDGLPDISAVLPKITKVKKILHKIETRESIILQMATSVDGHIALTKVVEKGTKEVKKLETELPAICPLCGGPMRKECIHA